MRNRARTRIYTDTFQGLADGGQITLRIQPQEPVWVRFLQGWHSGANENVDVQIRIENEQPFNTTILRWTTVIGTAALPMPLKAPWYINRYQTIECDVLNLTGAALDGSLAIVTTPTYAVPNWQVPTGLNWQLRTKIYGLRFGAIAGGGQQTANLRLDRGGLIWTCQGHVIDEQGVVPNEILVEYGMHQHETISDDLAYWQSVVGTAQRPLWFPQPIPLAAQDSLQISVNNQNAEYQVTPEIAFQVVPTGPSDSAGGIG